MSEGAAPEKAWKLCNQMLIEDPKDVRALMAASFIMRRMGWLPQAYHFGRSASQLAPHEPVGWINFGHACSEMWLIEEAERYYQTALKLSKSDVNVKACLLNLGALYVDNGLYERGITITRKLLEMEPTHEKALSNLGLCKLSFRDWSGWVEYHKLIGCPWRPRVVYKDEPEWDGEPGKKVVIYAEQGIGDEVLFASVIPDAARVCKKLIFDCDGRLQGLFRRSFPHITVYGTRVKDEKWAKEDWDFDASLPIGQLGEFFRRSDESFPREPYLTACPVRTAQWGALFTLRAEPVIGIAWTGGTPKNGQRIRRASLDDFLPLFRSVKAHFVCLQYQDASDEIAAFLKKHPDIDLVQYPWATLTSDYDDTAGLVASLDAVVGVPTSVIHLAGALGTPTFAMKASASCWKYQSGLPFHPATIIEWNESWKQTIKDATGLIQAHLGCSSATTPGSPSPTTFFSIPSSVTQAVRSALPRSFSGNCRSNGAVLPSSPIQDS